jgi:hypothetical protein
VPVQVLQVDLVNDKGSELMELDIVNIGQQEGGDIIEEEVEENIVMVGSKDDNCARLINTFPTTSDGDSDLMDNSMGMLSGDKGGDICINAIASLDSGSLIIPGWAETDNFDKVSVPPKDHVSMEVGFKIPGMEDVVITGTNVGGMMPEKEGHGGAMMNIMKKCDYPAMEENGKDMEPRAKESE